jgi:hypothetical protein
MQNFTLTAASEAGERTSAKGQMITQIVTTKVSLVVLISLEQHYMATHAEPQCLSWQHKDGERCKNNLILHDSTIEH